MTLDERTLEYLRGNATAPSGLGWREYSDENVTVFTRLNVDGSRHAGFVSLLAHPARHR